MSYLLHKIIINIKTARGTVLISQVNGPRYTTEQKITSTEHPCTCPSYCEGGMNTVNYYEYGIIRRSIAEQFIMPMGYNEDNTKDGLLSLKSLTAVEFNSKVVVTWLRNGGNKYILQN